MPSLYHIHPSSTREEFRLLLAQAWAALRSSAGPEERSNAQRELKNVLDEYAAREAADENSGR